ncbi:hypothetical protein QL093DRAFT_2485889 [Fusarium oxysporum]|nr:hypothetical protein QL093DRAFT_2485889 [Fusarium oxysporum]
MLTLQFTHVPPNILPRSLVSHQHYFELLGFNCLGLIHTKATIIDIVEPYHRRGIPSNHDSSLQIVDKLSAEWQLPNDRSANV